MSDIGAMVGQLIGAGCSPEVAAEVVARAFMAGVSSVQSSVTERDVTRDERDERRRELARLRQQKKRQQSRVTVTHSEQYQIDKSVTVTRDVNDASTLKERKKEESKKESRQREQHVTVSRGHRLPDGWSPTSEDWAKATEKLGQIDARNELAKFRDHWKAQPGQRGVKLNWDATFRNWIRNARGAQNGHRTANPRATGHDAILAAATRAAGKIAGNGAMAGAADEAEFPFWDGIDGERSAMDRGSLAGGGSDHDGGQFAGGRVLEGEVIAPDKAAAGISDGRRDY